MSPSATLLTPHTPHPTPHTSHTPHFTPRTLHFTHPTLRTPRSHAVLNVQDSVAVATEVKGSNYRINPLPGAYMRLNGGKKKRKGPHDRGGGPPKRPRGRAILSTDEEAVLNGTATTAA